MEKSDEKNVCKSCKTAVIVVRNNGSRYHSNLLQPLSLRHELITALLHTHSIPVQTLYLALALHLSNLNLHPNLNVQPHPNIVSP